MKPAIRIVTSSEPEDICPTCTTLSAKVRDLQEVNDKLMRALHREADHHLDVRAPNTDRPTRERLTNGNPAARGGRE